MWDAHRIVEIGCGFGIYLDCFSKAGFETAGIDISPTAIAKARDRFPNSDFSVGSVTEHALIRDLRPDILVMADVTWYVLDHLRDFLDFLRTELPDTLVLHLLPTYPEGRQRYGRDYFTDLAGIRRWFGMHYLESGEAHIMDGGRRTWFLGTWKPERLADWSKATGITPPDPTAAE